MEETAPQDVYAQMVAEHGKANGQGGPSPLGRLSYMVEHPDGGQGEIDENELSHQLRQIGYQPLGSSADGQTIKIQGAQGPYDVRASDVLNKLGWQVKGFKPTGAVYDHIDMGMRALVESPALKHDDAAKADLIKGKLMRQGLHDPQVVGQGSDWYAFDPAQSRWFALTNKPGMDMSDLSEVAARAPGMLGSGAGMALGAEAGPAGMMAGSAGGGFLGNRLVDSVAGMADPDYAKYLDDKGAGNQAVDWAKDAGVDAIGGLGGFGLGKLGGAVGRGLMGKGLASRGLEAAGGSAELTGRAVQGVSDFMGTGLPRQLAIDTLDPTGIGIAGDLAGVPAQAIRGTARGLGHIGESGFMAENAPGTSKWLSDISKRLLAKRSGIGPNQTQAGASDVMGNAGDILGGKIGRMRAANVIKNRPDIIGDGLGKEWEEALAQDYAPELGKSFESLGRGAENVERLGSMARNAVSVPYDIAVGAGRLGGRALKYGGQAARKTGEALGSVETPMELKYGSEEIFNRMRKRQSALQNQGYNRTLVPESQWAGN